MSYIPAWECAWHLCTNIIPEGNINRTCSVECRRKYQGSRQSAWHLHRKEMEAKNLHSEAQEIAERIKANIYSHPVTGGVSDCENWMGSLSSKGYPTMRIHGKTELVRRVVWILYMTMGQPIPDGIEIVETCGNFQCVLLEDLMAVTASERARFGAEMGTHRKMRYDIDAEKIKEFRPRLIAGERLKDLAAEVDMTDRGLSYILRGNRAGDPPLTEEEQEFFSRKRAPSRKALTPEQVLEAERRWKDGEGESIASLAREFEVGREAMSDAIHKRGAYELD